MENVTASTHRLSAITGVHLFKIAGHSLIKRNDIMIESNLFRVGGHNWAIEYYPYGTKKAARQHTSVFLHLKDASEVRANFSFCLQDPALPSTGEKLKRNCTTHDFKPCSGWGFAKFISINDLAASGCLKDDCLVIKCNIEVITADRFEGLGQVPTIVIPPSELCLNIGDLLENGLKADLTVKIGWFKRFKVHGCVLAARSSVFRAQLCGSMMESRRSSICIKDMDARIFEALLYYMYKDSLPAFMDDRTQEAANMTVHLLVAADRYAIERLKVICESKLSELIDVNTVAFTLDFAERYHCQQLKDCCVRYMVHNGERCRAIMETKGFMELRENHKSLAREVIDKAFGT
ncbi:BTB/POZ and MATH domain-containing protein 2-like [Lolium rigidum]|uniref:BTB/POZ and MATH domain-containing protein 2-like n=1 Tax=Lolium rigidum TaxID=89674 RepID=UPI001F5D4CA8|nr:BTB/POZ and MATH domain-containing protein 2-like [Lolium rigidum]